MKTRVQETVRNAANSLSEFTHHDQVQAGCLRRVSVPDPVTGRWKRPRPEHAEGSERPAKDPLMEQITFHKLRKNE